VQQGRWHFSLNILDQCGPLGEFDSFSLTVLLDAAIMELGRDAVWSGGMFNVEAVHEGVNSIKDSNVIQRSWRKLHARRDDRSSCMKCLTDFLTSFLGCCYFLGWFIYSRISGCLHWVPSIGKKNRDFLQIFQDKLIKSFQTKIKIVFSMLQLLSLLPGVFNLDLPDIYLNFLDNLSIVSLDLSKFAKFFSFGCVISPTFYEELLVTTLAPVGVAILLSCTAWVAWEYRHLQTERKVHEYETDLKRARYQQREADVHRIVLDLQHTIEHNEQSVRKAVQRCKWCSFAKISHRVMAPSSGI